MRGKLLTCLLCLAMMGVSVATLAQDYPMRPIKLVVAQGTGGTGDTHTRIVAAELSERLNIPVIVENKPGGAFILGTDHVAKSPADGYTLLSATLQGLNILPGPEKLPYDPDRDLLPIAINGSTDSGYAVSTKLGVKNLQEFVALAKAKPGVLTFGSGGVGSQGHFVGEMFKLATGVNLLHVPFKSGNAALAATLAGQVDLAITATLGMATHRDKLVPLALTDEKRNPAVPDVPTMVELGYPDVVITFWFGIFAPTGTPRPIIARLSKTSSEFVASPKYVERIRKYGFIPKYEGPEEFARTVVTTRKIWQRVVRETGIKAE